MSERVKRVMKSIDNTISPRLVKAGNKIYKKWFKRGDKS